MVMISFGLIYAINAFNLQDCVHQKYEFDDRLQTLNFRLMYPRNQICDQKSHSNKFLIIRRSNSDPNTITIAISNTSLT